MHGEFLGIYQVVLIKMLTVVKWENTKRDFILGKKNNSKILLQFESGQQPKVQMTFFYQELSRKHHHCGESPIR